MTLLEALTRPRENTAAKLLLQTLQQCPELRRVPAADRDEVVQDSYCKVLRAFDRGGLRLDNQTDAAARAYLWTIAKNTLNDRYRKKSNTAETTTAEQVEPARHSVAAETSGEASESLQQVAVLDRAVVAKYPALKNVFQQVQNLRSGSADSLAAFVPPELSEEERKKLRITLQQHHSRWRSQIALEAKLRQERGDLSDDDVRSLNAFVFQLRQRAPKKRASSPSEKATAPPCQ